MTESEHPIAAGVNGWGGERRPWEENHDFLILLAKSVFEAVVANLVRLGLDTDADNHVQALMAALKVLMVSLDEPLPFPDVLVEQEPRKRINAGCSKTLENISHELCILLDLCLTRHYSLSDLTNQIMLHELQKMDLSSFPDTQRLVSELERLMAVAVEDWQPHRSRVDVLYRWVRRKIKGL